MLFEKLQNEIRYQIDDEQANSVRWPTVNDFGMMLRVFFDGVRELVILGLTRSDPFVDPLDAMIDAIGDVFGNQCRIVYNHFRDPG